MAFSQSPDEMIAAAASAEGEQTLYTGRQIITFREGAASEGIRSLEGAAGTVARSSDFETGAMAFESVGDAGLVVFEELGIAVAPAGAGVADQLSRASATESIGTADSAIEAIEPETFVFPYGHDLDSYLAGFAAAAERIRGDMLGGQAHGADPTESAIEGVDASALAATWGLIATRGSVSRFTGRGIKVAVLDTGMDLGHPDFRGRAITSQSFIAGQPVQDLHSHGTHCIGTACGPRVPAGGVGRYGLAFEAAIFAGKVLSNSGGGTSATVLGGMDWAIRNRCEVISMSLGSASPVTAFYTAAGQRALNAGCLIVAAAGNDSNRPASIRPTGSPGNSPTIMAVAALDPALKVARFSNGGKIEIAAPGVDTFSSIPMPRRYGLKSGTSMATPHVAGCAALWAQSSPSFRAVALMRQLQRSARRLPLPASDVGAGLVQAP